LAPAGHHREGALAAQSAEAAFDNVVVTQP